MDHSIPPTNALVPLNQSAIAAAPSPSRGGQPFSYHTILSALRCWWKLATPLGLLLAMIAGAVVYFISDPTYTAEVWLIIRERQDHLLDIVSREDPKKFIANQIEMMRSPPIINPVAAIPQVAKTPEIAREVDPVQAIKRQISIVPKGQSEYFVVRFASADPKCAALIPNEVAKAYLELQQRTEGFRTNELIKLLNDELSQQQGVVEENRSVWYREYKNALGIAPEEVQLHNQAAKVVTVPGIESALQNQLLNAEVELMLLDVRIRFEDSQPPAKPTPLEIERFIQNDPRIQRLQATRAGLEPKIKDHKDVSANPGVNPLLRELEKQKKKSEDELASALEEVRPQIEAELEKAAKMQHESELLRLRDRRAGLETLVNAMNERLKNQEVKAESQQEVKRDVKDRMFKVDLLKSDYERAQQRYDALKKRIDMMGLEQRAPSRVEVYEYATIPTLPDEAAPYKKIGMAAMVAFAIPFGLAVGFELLLRRIGSRDELEKGGAISVVGEVTELPRTARPAIAADGKPNRDVQLFEESVDGLRTYLTLVQSLQGMRALAVASSVSREGKTSLATQLAVSLAQATGERTLLIDGDMRSPDIHRIFDVERGPGLAAVLRGETSVEQAIDTNYSETLHIMPAGYLTANPHRLVGNGEFARLLDKLKGMYRYVIIDTPPVLPASEALVLAQAADAAILCVRRDFSRLGQVAEACSRLRAAGVKTAGAVLNGIPSREYSYHYGTYSYSAATAETTFPEVGRHSVGADQPVASSWIH